MKDEKERSYQEKTINGDDYRQVDLAWDTLTGVAVYAVFALCLMAAYVGIFGYGGGHLIHYALADTLGIPISFDTCFNWGLIPGLNIIGLFIAGQVLMWKLLLTVAWEVLLWLLDALPPFLREWSNNLK